MARKDKKPKAPLKWFAPSLTFFLPTDDGLCITTGLPLLEAASYEDAVKAVTTFINQGLYLGEDSMYVSPIDGTPIDLWHMHIVEIDEEYVKRYERGWRKKEMLARGELPLVPTRQGGVIIPMTRSPGLALVPKPASEGGDPPETPASGDETKPPSGGTPSP